ncbi:MAG: fatty acid desaturase [Caulobacteraceae bacterium]|nr:fatty acid desaturase [Caulobacteraceae bacterium]
MSDTATTPSPWRKILAAYQKPHAGRSIFEIVVSAGPLAVIWVAAWFAAIHDLWWLALPLSAPAAVFLVRLFMVQHDCGHRAFFKSPAANDWTGRVIGLFTLTPYDCWRRTHAIHHASSGDLDRRGLGALATLTIDEYRALGLWGRFGYRFYRHPLVLFVVGPAYLFFFEQRLPVGLMREGWRPWVSAMGANAAVAAFIVVAILLGGWKGLVFVQAPTMLIAASIGVWLFYVQHQFEHTYWERRDKWDATDAALRGSSYYALPPVLAWLTGHIGVHHVHHVSSRIPFYRLPTVLRDYPELKEVSRLSLGQSLNRATLSLWDEAGQKLVSFRQAREAA